MLEETHRRIARTVAYNRQWSERWSGLLEAGSVEPDYSESFPHHYGKELDIIKNLSESKRFYEMNSDEWAYKLGVAFHYIQDKWTFRPRTKDKHTKWETEINEAQLLDSPAFEEEVQKARALPTSAITAYLGWQTKRKDFLAYLDRPTTYSLPFIDLNIAYRVCIATSFSYMDTDWSVYAWNIAYKGRLSADRFQEFKALFSEYSFEELNKELLMDAYKNSKIDFDKKQVGNIISSLYRKLPERAARALEEPILEFLGDGNKRGRVEIFEHVKDKMQGKTQVSQKLVDIALETMSYKRTIVDLSQSGECGYYKTRGSPH